MICKTSLIPECSSDAIGIHIVRIWCQNRQDTWLFSRLSNLIPSKFSGQKFKRLGSELQSGLLCAALILAVLLFGALWPYFSVLLSRASLFGIPLAYFIVVLLLPMLILAYLFYFASRQEKSELQVEDGGGE